MKPTKLLLQKLIAAYRTRGERKEMLPAEENLTYLDRNWLEKHQLFQDYVSNHGHGRIPRVHKSPNGIRLGEWVQSQRQLNGKMDSDRQAILENTPHWLWTVVQDWQTSFECFKALCDKTGQAHALIDFETKDGFKLGLWVASQRARYAKGRLEEDRVFLLETIPRWRWRRVSPYTQGFKESFDELVTFQKKHGHVKIPVNFQTPRGASLNSWLKTHISAYNKGLLCQEQIDLFESIPNWVWGRKDQWNQDFTRLQKYVREHKSLPPCKHPLFKWVANQRHGYSQGYLSKEKRLKLESLSTWSWRSSVRTPWEVYYSQWVELAKGGACSSKLLHWAANQRYLYKKGTLCSGRLTKLEALENWSWEASSK